MSPAGLAAGASMRSASRGWVTCYESKPHAFVRLFCFAYAGGSSVSFRDWTGPWLSDIEVCPIETPGHGLQMAQPALSSMEPLVSKIAAALPLEKPFGFLGHSVGALVAFEVIRELRRTGRRLPDHFFPSACRGPRIPESDPHRNCLPDEKLLAELVKLGGTSSEILADAETIRLFLPSIRADFALSENYTYRAEQSLPVPITVLGGADDKEVKPEEMAQWRSETSARFDSHVFPGGHFFIVCSRREVIFTLSRMIMIDGIYS